MAHENSNDVQVMARRVVLHLASPFRAVRATVKPALAIYNLAPHTYYNIGPACGLVHELSFAVHTGMQNNVALPPHPPTSDGLLTPALLLTPCYE